jgi:outer membrane protein OmpA-like peptidoglycan-associated protein
LSPFSNQPKNRCVFKGFASNKGNPVYNQNLSLQRTENVKKYLVKKGIHPSRILTQYMLDYGATKEELARRVELSLLSESSFGSHHIFKIDIRYKIL